MPSLKDTIIMLVKQAVAAQQPAEMQIGTVTGVDPIEITVDTTMQVLKESVLYLSETVVEKSIPILEHTHNTPQGVTDAALMQADITCDENGSNLGTQGGRIIFNNGLSLGDKVILMRVQGGQKFVIVSRTFNFGAVTASQGGGG